MPKQKRSQVRKREPFDKYDVYSQAVQSPENDVRFFRKLYREHRERDPEILREDFCGTFSVCCEWVRLNPHFKAFGLDLDLEPIQYGREHNLPQLKPEQQSRLLMLQKNVLDENVPRADVIVGLNFSYYILKTRPLMKRYFLNCLKSLRNDGVLILDAFGGSLCQKPTVESTKFRKFTYFWEQASFNPIDHSARFHIHFQRKGERKRRNVFSYDWRMWTLPELRDILEEVGFKSVYIYWEGTKANGTGNGIFKRKEVGDAALSWIAYLVALK